MMGIYIFGASLFLFYGCYHHPENFIYCAAASLFVSIGISIPYNPTNGLARIHFGILIYGLLAVILLNCFLVSFMTKPQYERQISTTEDLLQYKYKIMISPEFTALNDLGTDEVIPKF